MTEKEICRFCQWAAHRAARVFNLSPVDETDLYQECWLAYLLAVERGLDKKRALKAVENRAWNHALWLLCGRTPHHGKVDVQIEIDDPERLLQLSADRRDSVDAHVYLRKVIETCAASKPHARTLRLVMLDDHKGIARKTFCNRRLELRKFLIDRLVA